MLRPHKVAMAPPPAAAPAADPNCPGEGCFRAGDAFSCRDLFCFSKTVAVAYSLFPTTACGHRLPPHVCSIPACLQLRACASAASAATRRCSPLRLLWRPGTAALAAVQGRRTPLICATLSCRLPRQHATQPNPGQLLLHRGWSQRQQVWQEGWQEGSPRPRACRLPAALQQTCQLCRCQLCSRRRRAAAGPPLAPPPAWDPPPGVQLPGQL